VTGVGRVARAAAVIAAVGAAAACQAKSSDTPPADRVAPEVSVTIAPIVRTTLHAYANGWGHVEAEPASDGRPAASARVTAPVSGLVISVSGHEGQRVAQGTMLFRLDNRVADIAVARAQQAVRVAEQLVKRQEELGPGQATSQKAYQEATAQLAVTQGELVAAELQRRLLEVRAPSPARS